MSAMRILFALVFSSFFLFAFSQRPVEKEGVISSDSTLQLSLQKPQADTVFEIFNLQKAPVFRAEKKS